MVSIIVPCYNSTGILLELVRETIQILEENGYAQYEFVLVNDASPKAETLPILQSLAQIYPFVKIIDLAKNTGQPNAQITALRYAQGDIIINMDDDMQTHPKNIPALLAKLDEGYDLVIGSYPSKKHSRFRNLLTKMDDIFADVVLHKPPNIKFTSFWATRKYIRDVMIQYTHPYAFMEGLFLRTTTNIANVEIEHFERQEGESGYNFIKLVRLWSNFTNFTVLPLRIAGLFGILCSLTGFIFSCVVVVRKILHPEILAGYTSLLCVMLLFFGIVLIGLGIVGEYIGRIFMCINSAPQQVIKRTINIPEQQEE